MHPQAIFLLNLVQDVNILRPLVIMAARDFGFKPVLLVSSKFIGRDLYGIWQSEIEQLCAEIGAESFIYANDLEAHRHLTGTGIIFAGSESNLPAHAQTHDVFRHAPPTYLKVTLQHGFECIGFRHSGDHILAHGPTASFGADIVCAWYGLDGLTAMAPSQRSKLLVTGPSALLQQPLGEIVRTPGAPGIVCENLHSVRLNIAGDFRTQFVDAFGEYCGLLRQDRRTVTLRPHPGGQYVLKNKVALPVNARINNAPMYKLDLRKFAYGISAPSSVLIDMLLAGIPTAVWRDTDGTMDADSYAGLTTVSTPREWAEFGRAAEADPAPFVALQRGFLERTGMPLDPPDIFARYGQLFAAARRIAPIVGKSAAERDRVLFVANANVPTLQLSFEKPLAPLVERGALATDLLTEADLREAERHGGSEEDLDAWIDRRLAGFDPRLIVFCRYSGPHYERIIAWAKREQVPILYHIDDDLLAIPEDVGARKHALHNAPERLAAVRHLLTSADLVYASTEKLKARLLDYFPDLPVEAGKIYCSGAVLRTPPDRAARKVGYMASADHAHNLAMILPAIVGLLDRHPRVGFELFGSIPIPPELERFGSRVTTAPPIGNYNGFLEEFAKCEWDVGICPLSPIAFNLMKANTKWVEYTSAGAAVVASRGTVYDDCCADGCGILADTAEEWLEALELLVTDDDARLAQVELAQRKLEHDYTI
ncbi:MAG: glycosyltransferase, partial [Pseudomonadota bacterium]|nr:glycosyltransferase [Pseudomonadota bacterium]